MDNAQYKREETEKYLAKCFSNTKSCHIGCDNTLGEKKDNFAKFFSITTHKGRGQKKKSERPVDALAVKTVNHPLTDNLESRDASASKNRLFF